VRLRAREPGQTDVVPDVGGKKVLSAAGLLVIFSRSYLTEFTEALMTEARLIQARFLAKRTTPMVYVPDGPNPAQARRGGLVRDAAAAPVWAARGLGRLRERERQERADELGLADVAARSDRPRAADGPTDGLEGAPCAALPGKGRQQGGAAGLYARRAPLPHG
jgi:hypothetical protein